MIPSNKKTFQEALRRLFGFKSIETKSTIQIQRNVPEKDPEEIANPSKLDTNDPLSSSVSRMQSSSAAYEQSGKRIIWVPTSNEIESPPSPTEIKHSEASDIRIDWGGGHPSEQMLGDFRGIEDAFDHTVFKPGEYVAFCKRDKVAYHISTWEFLRTQNQGRCCICGLTDVIKFITLPSFDQTPVYSEPIVRPQFPGFSGDVVINLKQVPGYIGRAVVVQDYVYEVYKTQNTGTCFIRFEPRRYGDKPFSGFKLVVFPKYQYLWDEKSILLESYQGQYIRARGIVQTHDTWGIEILLNSPNLVEVVDDTYRK